VATPSKPGQPGAAAGKPVSGEDALVRSKREKEELTGEVQHLEEEVEELKVKYEMYFLGNERREPVRWREDLKKKVLRVKGAFTRNTGLRFRIQSLHARFISYERLWMRSAREKEEGTYRRDLFKARLRRGDAAADPARAKGAADAEDVDLSDLAPAPARPAAPAAAPRAKPPAAPAPGRLADAQMRELYDAYVAAKKRCNEDVSKLSYEAVSKSVSKQIPELMDRYKAKAVDFKVVIKDGRAILKAIPRA
jgi:hypothetical protein